LREPAVTVVIPTLAADSALTECLQSLDAQTRKDFEIIIVDNSGRRLVRQRVQLNANTRLIENDRNAGFGGAFNQAFEASSAPFIATLNDDATACPNWVGALVEALESHPDAGMCASRVLLGDGDCIDSAGMLVAADGSSKQRGHNSDRHAYDAVEEVLLPSGSAALYRRRMLDQIGTFDEDFFLYCEDTDLGLRARWAGWKCVYVPDAIVHHRYSHSSGRASALKAYFVERNRLFVIVKNFPISRLLTAPLASVVRYFWHTAAMFSDSGVTAEFRQHTSGFALIWFVLKAHFAALAHAPGLLRKRREIQKTAKVPAKEFCTLLDAHGISLRQVATL
jgi:GT2 family glycosyltransferase